MSACDTGPSTAEVASDALPNHGCAPHSNPKSQTNYISIHLIFSLARPKAISLLPCPEHHIRIPGDTHSTDANLTRNPFPFLELDIVGRENVGKQHLGFVDCKESSGADTECNRSGQESRSTCRNTYHACRPSPKAKCSLDTETD